MCKWIRLGVVVVIVNVVVINVVVINVVVVVVISFNDRIDLIV